MIAVCLISISSSTCRTATGYTLSIPNPEGRAADADHQHRPVLVTQPVREQLDPRDLRPHRERPRDGGRGRLQALPELTEESRVLLQQTVELRHRHEVRALLAAQQMADVDGQWCTHGGSPLTHVRRYRQS